MCFQLQITNIVIIHFDLVRKTKSKNVFVVCPNHPAPEHIQLTMMYDEENHQDQIWTLEKLITKIIIYLSEQTQICFHAD